MLFLGLPENESDIPRQRICERAHREGEPKDRGGTKDLSAAVYRIDNGEGRIKLC